MSLFTRIPPLPITRRAYSSFFSSKPGGRYFNSTKPPKSVVTAGKSKAENVNVNDGAVNGSSSAHSGSGTNKMKAAGGEEQASAQTSPSITNTAATHDTSRTPHGSSHNSTGAPLLSTTSPSTSTSKQFTPTRHPVISPQDYKLHQFFSLHRPLLLHAQPTSAIFESPQQFDLFVSPLSQNKAPSPPAHLGTVDDPPEASPEADADAARQLARALVMNRVGGTISWEDTLTRLGMAGGNTEEVRAALAKKWAREWETVYADSVKRKRKKKMKKHKLKKRRRAQRSQKLRLR